MPESRPIPVAHCPSAYISPYVAGVGIGIILLLAVLPDGLLSWIDQIVEPRLTAFAPTATSHERATRREHLELSRYFGGTPFVSPAPSPRENGKIRASEAAAVARIMRRGC